MSSVVHYTNQTQMISIPAAPSSIQYVSYLQVSRHHRNLVSLPSRLPLRQEMAASVSPRQLHEPKCSVRRASLVMGQCFRQSRNLPSWTRLAHQSSLEMQTDARVLGVLDALFDCEPPGYDERRLEELHYFSAGEICSAHNVLLLFSESLFT